MSKSPVMSIGAVAKAVGLSEGTLRNWERRYGYPKPQRTDGGHRVYGQEVVDFLNLVARAIRLGHRPAVEGPGPHRPCRRGEVRPHVPPGGPGPPGIDLFVDAMNFRPAG